MSKLQELEEKQTEVLAYLIPIKYIIVYKEVVYRIINGEKEILEVSSINNINKGK